MVGNRFQGHSAREIEPKAEGSLAIEPAGVVGGLIRAVSGKKGALTTERVGKARAALRSY